MADAPDALQQKCPACGATVDVTEAEPLANIFCPACGEKTRVQSAFDHFVLVETLGAGGMGSVYKARDTRLDRFVALKLLHKELSADPAEAARLEQEARVTASVNHPNVVQVYSAGSAHGQIYVVMELVDHGSLDDLMAHKARVPEPQALRAGIEVAKGLQAAHEKGLIHRDVKPANILFSQAQVAKIGDFGLAGIAEEKSEAKREIWGTPYYVAPERLNNEPEDFRSDIYSLGATLFHALAGRPPMEGDTTSATELRNLKSHQPDLRATAPDLDKETSKVINRMLAPKPANRFTSYAHLIDALERAARHLPSADDKSDPRKSKMGLKIAAAAALLTLLALAGFLFFHPEKISAPAAPSVSVTPDETTALPQRHEAARREPINGKRKEPSTGQKRLEQERPDWNTALTKSQAEITAYDFIRALTTINAARPTESSLQKIQAAESKRMQWLVSWKARLISDLNTGRYRASITDLPNVTYEGVTGANASAITLRIPDGKGTATVKWTVFSPKTLLAISSAFFPVTPPKIADRQWLAAVFARATGQTEAAQKLGEAAANARPEYREQLPLLQP